MGKKTLGKVENAGYQHCLLFPQCFQKVYSSWSWKPGIVWERVNSICQYITTYHFIWLYWEYQFYAVWIFIYFHQGSVTASPGVSGTVQCNFETKDLCGYSQPRNTDNFDWTWKTGSSPTRNTGPTVDHTTGTNAGKREKVIVKPLNEFRLFTSSQTILCFNCPSEEGFLCVKMILMSTHNIG